MADGIVGRLEQFLGQINELDELPHSFDDTLIDKFVDNITRNAEVTSFLYREASSGGMKQCGPVRCAVVLRLLNKFLDQYNSAEQEALLKELLGILTDQQCPAVRICALEIAISLRKYVEQLQTTVNSAEWEAMPIKYTGNLGSFLLDELSKPLDSLVRESYHRLLTHFLESLPPVNLDLMIMSARTFPSTESAIQLLVAILAKSSHETASGVLTDGWTNEAQRINALSRYIERTRKMDTALINSMLNSPKVKLLHFLRVARQCEAKEDFRELCQTFGQLISEKLLSSSLQTELFPELIELFASFKMDWEESQPFFLVLMRNVMEKPIILERIAQLYGFDKLKDDALTWDLMTKSLDEALDSDEWELCDSAIELLACCRSASRDFLTVRLDKVKKMAVGSDSPYVRASALRCLALHQHDCALEIAWSRIAADNDPQPRFEAAQILKAHFGSSSVDGRRLLDLLPKLLNDCDIEVREEAVNVVAVYLRSSQDQSLAAACREELNNWTYDAEIGQKVQRLLSLPHKAAGDVTVKLLDDMLRALTIVDDDTIDCY
ncbi:unnamed protein product, partial [Mesorhabditis spiculigera]